MLEREENTREIGEREFLQGREREVLKCTLINVQGGGFLIGPFCNGTWENKNAVNCFLYLHLEEKFQLEEPLVAAALRR